MNDYDIVIEALRRHNSGEMKLSDIDAEKLATQAKAMGERFAVRSKPISKGAFDFADMATFGLLPDEWRPYSQGQEIFGETGIDKISGTIGSLGGLVTGAGVATKGAKMGWNAIKKTFARKKADDIATNVYKGNLLEAGPRIGQLGPARPLPPGPRTPQLPAGPNTPQLGQGSPLSLSGGPYGQLGPAVKPGNIGLSLAEQQRRLQEAIASMRANPLPRYQIGGMHQERRLQPGMQPGMQPQTPGMMPPQTTGMIPPQGPQGLPQQNPGMLPPQGVGTTPGMPPGMNPGIVGGQPRPVGGMQPIGGMQPSAMNPNMPRRRPMGMQEGGYIESLDPNVPPSRPARTRELYNLEEQGVPTDKFPSGWYEHMGQKLAGQAAPLAGSQGVSRTSGTFLRDLDLQGQI